MQQAFGFEHQPEVAVGDELDRCYTPQTLADAIVARVDAVLLEPPKLVIEPSCGGGAFVRAIRGCWPDARIIGCDIDPDAIGLGLVDDARVGDWPSFAACIPQADIVIGNPPFTGDEGIRQVLASREGQPGAILSMVLPLAYVGVKRWLRLVEHPHPRNSLAPIVGRPWPDKLRETANYVWPGRLSAPGWAPIEPAIDW